MAKEVADDAKGELTQLEADEEAELKEERGRSLVMRMTEHACKYSEHIIFILCTMYMNIIS
jgi:hypothetical protein